MSTKTDKEIEKLKEVKEVQPAIFISQGTMLKQHPFGDIVFFNTDLVTPNTLDILMASLDVGDFKDDGHGVLSVVFRDDGYPMAEDGVLNAWAFSCDAHCAMCNIEHCITLVIEDGLNPDNKHSEKVSIFAGVWRTMLKGFFHECYHAHSSILEPHAIRFDDTFRKDDEELAPEFAKDQLFDMAKTHNIEIDFTPAINEMINSRLQAEILRIEDDKKATKADKTWVYHQKYLLEHGGTFYAKSDDKDSEDYHLITFKEYLHFFSSDAEDDEAWNVDTIGITGTVIETPLNENANGNAPSTVNQAQVYTEPFEYDNFDKYIEPESEVIGFQGVQTQSTVMGAINQEYAQSNIKTVAEPGPVPQGPAMQAQQIPVQVGGSVGAIQLSAGADPQTVVNGLYLKMFTQIFQGCQYSPTMPMPFPGGGNITQWLELTDDEAKFVVNMTMYSADPTKRGTICPDTPVDRHISGIMIDKAGTLPGYKLTLQMPDGTIVKRNIFPQNPNKVSESGYVSEPAKLAKAGGQIMWIVDADTKEYKLRIRDGHFERNLGNYKWGV